MSAFSEAWTFLKGDAFHPSVTGFRTAARRGFSQPPMKDEFTFAEEDNHAERMPRPSPEQGKYGTSEVDYEEEEYDREAANRYNMERAQRAMEREERLKRTLAAFEEPNRKDALERLGF